MTRPPKKPLRHAKKGAKSAKMLISAAAFSATFGGWIAMANGNGSSSLFYQSPPPLVSSLELDSQASQQHGLEGKRSDAETTSPAQPPMPLSMTHSSR